MSKTKMVGKSKRRGGTGSRSSSGGRTKATTSGAREKKTTSTTRGRARRDESGQFRGEARGAEAPNGGRRAARDEGLEDQEGDRDEDRDGGPRGRPPVE